jgi:antitoxin MazE
MGPVGGAAVSSNAQKISSETPHALDLIGYTLYILLCSLLSRYLEVAMETAVQKWGNSLGIRIPASYAKDLNLENGSHVEIVEENGSLVIMPKRITLDEVLEKVTEYNLHAPIETGTPVGKEEW